MTTTNDSFLPNDMATSEEKPLEISDLPEEALEQILLRLPAASVLRVRAVCKSWLLLTTNKSFRLAHARMTTRTDDAGFIVPDDPLRQSNPYEFRTFVDLTASTPILEPAPRSDMVIHHSSGGLLLGTFLKKQPSRRCHLVHFDTMLVINPMTKECREIPLPCDPLLIFFFGIAPHPSRGSYTIVSAGRAALNLPNFSEEVHTPDPELPHGFVRFDLEVYTPEVGRWVPSKSKPLIAVVDMFGFPHIVYWNGVMHWPISWDELLCFDIENVSAWLTPLPPRESAERRMILHFGESAGRLLLIEGFYLYSRDYASPPASFHVKQMANDHSGWSVLYQVSAHTINTLCPWFHTYFVWRHTSSFCLSPAFLVRPQQEGGGSGNDVLLFCEPGAFTSFHFELGRITKYGERTSPEREFCPVYLYTPTLLPL